MNRGPKPKGPIKTLDEVRAAQVRPGPRPAPTSQDPHKPGIREEKRRRMEAARAEGIAAMLREQEYRQSINQPVEVAVRRATEDPFTLVNESSLPEQASTPPISIS